MTEPAKTEAAKTEPRACRMFPLGSVLVPHSPLPLHIFEPRYQQLLNESLEDDRTFGVVLISRGWEVGGGESRTSVGTLAHIDDYNRFDDGRAAVVSTGQSRIEVVEWLPDDPYPRAMVIDRPETPAAAEDQALFVTATASLDALLHTALRLDRIEAIPELSWPDAVDEATWRLAGLAPIAVIDRQRVLAADTVAERLTILDATLRAMREDLELMEQLDG